MDSVKLRDLRHRITLERVTNISDGQGGRDTTWATIETMWARVQSRSAMQINFGSALRQKVTHVIVVRYRTGITITDRFKWGSRIFQVHGVRAMNYRLSDEGKDFLMIDAEEGVGS